MSNVILIKNIEKHIDALLGQRKTLFLHIGEEDYMSSSYTQLLGQINENTHLLSKYRYYWRKEKGYNYDELVYKRSYGSNRYSFTDSPSGYKSTTGYSSRGK